MSTAQSNDENYVMTTTILNADATNKIKEVQYYNGLGYPTVSAATVGGNGETAYSLTTYDDMGREACKYLPVPNANNSIMYKSPGDIMELSSKANYNDNTAYTMNHYDAFSRVTSVELPGKEWRNNDKRNRNEYSANTDDDQVIHYTAHVGVHSLVVPDQKSDNYIYPAGSLSKEITIDADDKRVETYKDFIGNVILERRFDGTTKLDTYYVYDEIGQLCYVLSPKFQRTGHKDITGFQYYYDSKGRMYKKYLPGTQNIEYWYDKNDRLICMRDANLNSAKLYRIFLYDKLGRVVVQGLCKNFKYNENLDFVATFAKSSDTGYEVCSDTRNSYSMVEVEIINFYDNYDFLKSTNLMSKYKFMYLSFDVPTSGAIGQLTGCVQKASNGEYLPQVMAYDSKGNILETRGMEIGGRVLSNTNTYTYTNNIASSSYNIDVKYGSRLTINEKVIYNRYNDKKEEVVLTISHGESQGENTMKYTYDGLGRLANISRPSSSVGYKYEMHGWLERISTNSFCENLYYANCFDKSANCFNGNISAMTWQNNDYTKNNKIELRGYTFNYDGANRLTDAFYGEREALYNHKNRYNEVLEYDENGNITKLQRRGKKQDGEYGKIDNLSLSYNGNQLTNVEEDAKDFDYEGSFEYKGANESRYIYNGNGSLVADMSRGIAYITYDYNNNPKQIYFIKGNVTKYVYNASGQKLRVVHYTAKPNIITRQFGVKPNAELTLAQILLSDSTDYLLGGSLVLKNGKIDKYLFEGGYAQAEPIYNGCIARPIANVYFEDEDGNVIEPSHSEETNKAWSNYKNGMDAMHIADQFTFYYYNQDHLGNNREVVDASGNVVQVTNYYPFGAPYADATAVKNPGLQQYKYNGKELDRMHGLNTYDYGARQHDPILGRWDRIDPHCESYYPHSPYAYCGNNPVMRIDLDGKDWYWDIDNTLQYSPNVHSAKDLQKGQSYVGTTYNTKYASFRKDGSILFNNESKAYNRMWDQANRHYRLKGEKGGREEGAFLLSNGKVLVLPDYKNDSHNSHIGAYGYTISSHKISKGKDTFSIIGQIHTHQNKEKGNETPSYYDGDDKIAARIEAPVFVLSFDGNVYGIVSSSDKYGIFSLPGQFKHVKSFLNTKYSFINNYIKQNNFSIK